MPPTEQILNDLQRLANDWQTLAICWHLYFGFLLLALFSSALLSKRTANILLAAPLLSVGTLAWFTGNPFNGLVFSLSAVALILIGRTWTSSPARIARGWVAVSGAVLFVFGWVYPHFLETSSWVPYLYSAPTGLIPCPTLAMVMAIGLLAGGFGSFSWPFLTGFLGVFYGVFGTVRLGVQIDWILAAGGGAVLLLAARNRPARRLQPAAKQPDGCVSRLNIQLRRCLKGRKVSE